MDFTIQEQVELAYALEMHAKNLKEQRDFVRERRETAVRDGRPVRFEGVEEYLQEKIEATESLVKKFKEAGAI